MGSFYRLLPILLALIIKSSLLNFFWRVFLHSFVIRIKQKKKKTGKVLWQRISHSDFFFILHPQFSIPLFRFWMPCVTKKASTNMHGQVKN